MSLSIALTKGRLEKQTVTMLEELGYGVEALKTKVVPWCLKILYMTFNIF